VPCTSPRQYWMAKAVLFHGLCSMASTPSISVWWHVPPRILSALPVATSSRSLLLLWLLIRERQNAGVQWDLVPASCMVRFWCDEYGESFASQSKALTKAGPLSVAISSSAPVMGPPDEVYNHLQPLTNTREHSKYLRIPSNIFEHCRTSSNAFGHPQIQSQSVCGSVQPPLLHYGVDIHS
jgi:hypothetical protein